MASRLSWPYFDPDFDSLVDRIEPRVCIDNEACETCTLVKVDSANRHGILLEMVQLLTDLDLVIFKSYISSDGGWLMDVFHVADQFGNKLTDPVLIHYVQQALGRGQRERGWATREVTTCLGKLVGAAHLACDYAAVEVTSTDQPGLLSEIAAVLTELSCQVLCAQAWTHKSIAAIVLYLLDGSTRAPITDADRLANIERQVDILVEAHQVPGHRRRVKAAGPTPGRVHTERRLHQLLYEAGDYEAGPPPPPVDPDLEAFRGQKLPLLASSANAMTKTRVSIDSWKKRGYSVVNIQSRDRPKLLFDTVCTMTDMDYSVFHATVGSHGPLAVQEYYIQDMYGCTLESEMEKQKVIRCLAAAVQRRVSNGLRLEVSGRDRPGLLSDVTRVLRENSVSLTRAECATRGERATMTFYVTTASGGGDVDPKRVVASVEEELGEGIKAAVSSGSVGALNRSSSINDVQSATITTAGGVAARSKSTTSVRASFGSLLWSHIERLSNNFGSISP
ncbi:ACT domain-containing protein ACR1-like [Curcuma longa]|uniref:ACT domain-containing protein ACR1-like n=1 Tax=Curcuma longa TaxID=136217 RepID=UPI003D9F9939